MLAGGGPAVRPRLLPRPRRQEAADQAGPGGRGGGARAGGGPQRGSALLQEVRDLEAVDNTHLKYA